MAHISANLYLQVAQILVSVLERHYAVGGEHQRLTMFVEIGRADGTKPVVGDHLTKERLNADVRVDVVDAHVFVLCDADHLLPTSVQVHLRHIIVG